MKRSRDLVKYLAGGVAPRAVMLLGAGMAFVSPALAQDAQSAQSVQTAQATGTDDAPEITVTGSILRQTDKATVSPVTVLTTENLDQRGITTVQGAIQQLASSNGPALTNSFSANGAFASGASGASLRGLSTNSTLVLFDGMRAAYYPLADDGSRNFVDLNTIPDDIVDHVEVLRDGASSSYGADAIAGVINIITKKEFTGLAARAEAGVSGAGLNANQRLSLTLGKGHLHEDGFNVYVSGFYQHSSAVYNRDLPAPYNSDDQRSICHDGTCGPNNIINGLNGDGAFPDNGFATNGATLYVRPYDGTNSNALGSYQLLNPTAGCRFGTAYTPTAAELNSQNNAGLVPTTVCQQDLTHDYGMVSPAIERFGASARATVELGDRTEASLELNFQQSRVNTSGAPTWLNSKAPAGIDHAPYSTGGTGAAFAPGSFALTLPVYVCATGVGTANGLNTGCDAANGTLNPNNPFAAQGQVARLGGRLFNAPTSEETRSRVYRAAFNLHGELGDDWAYSVNATAMHTDLRLRTDGYVYIQHLLNAIAQGTYNFVDPDRNSQAVRDYVSPENITNDSSDLDQLQVTVSKPLFRLPGGRAQLGVGGEVRYEAVDSPSANPDYNGPTERYFTLNAFGTVGDRTVVSGFGEIDLPILEQVDVNASGRYDHYSSGQSNFSPKVGVKFTPIRDVVLRGTWSRGFRIPSFGEANSLPTTGYVSQSPSKIPEAIRAQYGAACAADATQCPNYLTNYSIGETTLASPHLKPEKSRSFTAGILVEPMRNVSFSVDFFDIKKTDVITAPSFSDAIAAYYAGQAAPAGFTITPDSVLEGFENALPRIAYVSANYLNANSQHAQGIDFAANGAFGIAPGVQWTTSASASLMLDLSTTFPGGRRESYVGTLGNFDLTAGTGTQRWRGNWTNTINSGPYSLSATVNYTSGYSLSTARGEHSYCDLSDGYTPCDVKSYLTVDMHTQIAVNDKFTLYFNVLNLFDRLPPIDPVTYGAYLYNPVVGGDGIFGREVSGGVKLRF